MSRVSLENSKGFIRGCRTMFLVSDTSSNHYLEMLGETPWC